MEIEVGMKILVVDDNAEIRRLIKSLVIDIADEVYECDGGAEAIEAYHIHHPDWVLMDVFMRKMDGLNAAKIIKIADPRAKILIVTNHTDKRTRQAAAAAG